MGSGRMRIGKYVVNVLNFGATVVSGMATMHVFYFSVDAGHSLIVKWLCFIGYVAVLLTLYSVYGVYDIGTSKVSELVYSQCLGNMLSLFLFYWMLAIANGSFVTPWPLVGLFLLQVLFSVLLNEIGNAFYFNKKRLKRTVVLYEDNREVDWFRAKYSCPDIFEIIAYTNLNGRSISALKIDTTGVEAVFAVGFPAGRKHEFIEWCVREQIEGYFIPTIDDILLVGAKHVEKIDIPTFSVGTVSVSPGYRMAKRLMDVIAASLGLIVLSPLMLVTAAAIKLTDRGPVFYTQTRLTKDRKTFRIYKFRSMRSDAEKDGIARLATVDDDRITPVGKLIRAARIDELPQLFNILTGDMTLVGPRPERPEIAAQYEEYIPQFALRLQVKAGLTGFAQIYGRYNTEPKDKLLMDLMYINHMSFHEDVRLILATIKILGQKEKSEGVISNQITAMGEQQKRGA